MQDPTENGGRRDLVPIKDYIVSFRIHEPFQQRCVVKSKPPRPGHSIQQIWLLGNQTLSNLKDKILCESDYQDIRGDISECPDVPIQKRAKVSTTYLLQMKRILLMYQNVSGNCISHLRPTVVILFTTFILRLKNLTSKCVN